ncbi:hypothetical protein ACP275_02G047600 [Erythranthe tilingii]
MEVEQISYRSISAAIDRRLFKDNDGAAAAASSVRPSSRNNSIDSYYGRFSNQPSLFFLSKTLFLFPFYHRFPFLYLLRFPLVRFFPTPAAVCFRFRNITFVISLIVSGGEQSLLRKRVRGGGLFVLGLFTVAVGTFGRG